MGSGVKALDELIVAHRHVAAKKMAAVAAGILVAITEMDVSYSVRWMGSKNGEIRVDCKIMDGLLVRMCRWIDGWMDGPVMGDGLAVAKKKQNCMHGE